MLPNLKSLLVSVVFLCFFALRASAQIIFEKGYFIDLEGNRVECLIKNVDWESNPLKFQYKQTETDEVREHTVETVREFAVYDEAKYIARTVDIDQSSFDLKYMSIDRAPEWKQETVFLKVILEGEASLYGYHRGNDTKYFYAIGDREISQLVYKQYRQGEGFATNNFYKQQLRATLLCESIGLSEIEGLTYQTNALKRLFVAYHECKGAEYNSYDTKRKKSYVNIAVRPGVKFSRLDASIRLTGRPQTTYQFGSQLGWRLGTEVEMVLPFHKNRWSVVVEPVFQYYKATESYPAAFLPDGELIAEFTYQSVEVPMSIRHYFFMSEQLKVFLNAMAYADFNLGSDYQHYRPTGEKLMEPDLQLSSKLSYGLGAGFQQNRVSVEARYQFSRDLLNEVPGYNTDYTSWSLILGYTITANLNK